MSTEVAVVTTGEGALLVMPTLSLPPAASRRIQRLLNVAVRAVAANRQKTQDDAQVWRLNHPTEAT